MSNKDIWDKLQTTDPKYTKNFSRKGGFKGTSQNPTYAIMKMTEHFGVIGSGWGIDKPEFTVQPVPNGDILVFCTVGAWVKDGEEKNQSWGVGGDYVASINKYDKLLTDDEAYKKAYTDAAMNALKYFGVGADLHLGMYDDVKYVNSLQNNDDKPAVKIIPATHDEVNALTGKITECTNGDELNEALQLMLAIKPRLSDEYATSLRATFEKKKAELKAVA